MFFCRLIIEESKQQSTLPTRILLDEWGTSGRKRATIYDLLQCLIQTKLYRAADFVATELLNEPAPQRSANGSCARYPILFDDIDSDTSISDHEVAEHLITNSNELEMNVCALEISSKTENSDSDQSHFTDSDPLSSNSNSQLGDSHKSNDESRKFNSNDPFLLPNLSMFDGLELNNMKKSQCHSGLSLRFNDECNSDDSNYIPDFTSLSSSLHRLDVSIKSNNESKKYNSDGSNFMPKFTSLNGSMHHLNSHLNGLKKANDESKKCNSDDSNFIPNFTL